VAGRNGYREEELYQMCIAAHLHDLGKLAVPNEILDKPSGLTEEEFDVIYAHPFYTRKGLEQVSVFGELAAWAANHHERLDGSGYPYGFRAEELSFEDKLFMALDVYQALTEDRPYRASMSHEKAMSILQKEAERGRLDAAIVEGIGVTFE
jgi:HD-GYP domain-containing protein (c-di-GMP phosphodiesterase class II)